MLTVFALDQAAASRGEATQGEIRNILGDMQKVRERQLPPAINFGDNNYVDIGLIDIPVFFNGDETEIKYLLEVNANEVLQENLKQLELVLGDAFKEYMATSSEQITMIIAPHMFAPDGTFQLKYHNVIFNLYKNGSNLKYIDIHSLLSGLAQKGKTISLIG